MKVGRISVGANEAWIILRVRDGLRQTRDVARLRSAGDPRCLRNEIAGTDPVAAEIGIAMSRKQIHDGSRLSGSLGNVVYDVVPRIEAFSRIGQIEDGERV